MTALRQTLHLPSAQLLLANLAHVFEAHFETLSQLAKTHPLAFVGLQDSATKIV